MAEESGGLLAEFVDHIVEKKVVVLEELAAEFGLRTQDAVSRVQALEQMGRITGVMDDRGKFIFISRDEMAEVAAFINRKGRVAIAELARKSSDFGSPVVAVVRCLMSKAVEKVFMISAETGNGIDDLRGWLAAQMPAGPFLFDPDDLSDMPLRLLAAEILREKLFLNLHQELPYQLTVETEKWEEQEDGSAAVHLSIYVAREGHRGIILGKQGQTIRRIGTAARIELEEALDRRLHLFSHVKVRKNWMDDAARYSVWDLDYDA